MSHVMKSTNLSLSREGILNVAKAKGLRVKENATNFYGVEGEKATGIAVNLPGWSKAVTFVENKTGGYDAVYDNYHGAWGRIEELVQFEGMVMADMSGIDPNSVIVSQKNGEMVFECEIA